MRMGLLDKRPRHPSTEMTFRDDWDVVHYVHATHTETLETLCERRLLYNVHHVPSNAALSSPTCLFCIGVTGRWIRPPFDPDDPRYRDMVMRALSA